MNANPTTFARRVRRRGSAVMEAALVFPVLISLTFGSIECGYFFFVKHTFQGAAREGSRAGIPPGATNADVVAAIAQTMSAAGFDSTKYTVQIRTANDGADLNVATAAPATGVLVKVTGVWGTVGVRPLGVLSDTKQVIGKTVMRKEG